MGVTLQDFVSLLKFQSSFYRLGLTPDASFRPCLPTAPVLTPPSPWDFCLQSQIYQALFHLHSPVVSGLLPG